MSGDYLGYLLSKDETTVKHHFFKRPDLINSLTSKSLPELYLSERKKRFLFLNRDVWSQVLSSFSEIEESISPKIDVSNGFLSVSNLDSLDVLKFESLVNDLIPWRKGPWEINNFKIESEWRSDYKYKAIGELSSYFKSKNIVDIGGGNGYYSFRTILDGANSNLIFDPSEKFFFQFELIQKCLKNERVQYEIGGYRDALNTGLKFDVAFCLGVFYHQKNPIELIEACRNLLVTGGTLIFETMVIEGHDNQILFPPDRYARSRNVYFLPTLSAMNSILSRSGFKNIELVEVRDSSLEEQRTTKHMPYESLDTFLNLDDLSLTVEGHPAPKRALFIASSK